MKITSAEAKEFIEKKLRIEKLDEKLNRDKLSLLNELIKAFHENIPFHNIGLLSLAKEERRQPNVEEINCSILSGTGGLCIVNNAGFKNLLEALNFDVSLIPSAVKNEYDHVLILAEVEKTRYIVDVGCGYPTLEAIPLDFSSESKIYRQSFLKFRFVRKGDVIERLHNHSRLIPTASSTAPPGNSTLWVKFYHFRVTPVDLSFFDETVGAVYTVPGTSPFLVSLRAFRYSNIGTVAFYNDRLLTEDDNNDLVETRLQSVEEIKSKLVELFPMLNLTLVNAALDVWEKDIRPDIKG